MFDTHAHLNFNTFKENSKEIIKKCLAKNIRIINVGSQYDTSARAIKIASEYKKGIYAAIGIHPIHLSQTEVDEEEIYFKSREEKFDKERYNKLLSKKVVAIGEIGLDYFHAHSVGAKNFLPLQKKGFIEQLEFAKEINLPVILHCRGAKDNPYEAYEEVLEILRNENEVSMALKKIPPSPPLGKGGIRGVIHCFGANLEIAEHFLELGFYIGFTGIITFKNVASELLEVVKNIPLERILVETDCPYLAPEPYRGKQCVPQYVEYTLRKVAEIKGISFEKAEKQTDKNARELFSI